MTAPVAPTPHADTRRFVIRGSGWALGSRLVLLLGSTVANVLLARVVAPKELGTYFVATNVVALLALVAQFGLNQGSLRLVAESLAAGDAARARSLVAVAVRLSVGVAVAAAVLVIASGRWTLGWFLGSSRTYVVLVLIGLWLVLTTLRLLLPELIRGFSDIRLASVTGDASTTLVMAAAFAAWFAAGRHMSLAAVLAVSVVASAVTVGFSGSVLARLVSALRATAWTPVLRETVRIGWPLLVLNATWAILQYSDVLIARALRSAPDVALYGAASRLAFVFAIPLVVVNAVVAPLVAAMNAKGRIADSERVLRATAFGATVATLVPVIVVLVAGSFVMRVLFGGFYTHGDTVLVLLSLERVAGAVTGACGTVLVMTGNERVMTVINVASAVVVLAAEYAGCRIWGINGLAAAAAGGTLLVNVLQVAVVRSRLGIWTLPTLSLRTLAAGIRAAR